MTTKKLSGRWNEEAGFVPHPPRSTKKKILEDPREGNPKPLNSVFSSSSDAQLFNYIKSCGINFLGSPNHKFKFLGKIRSLEATRVVHFTNSSGSHSRSDS